MNKELKLEDIAKLEATKLFEDLGYKLIDYPCYTGEILKIDYKLSISTWDEKSIRFIFYDNNIIIRAYEFSGYEMDSLDISPFLYPIMKLLEELQIDIKDVYFKKRMC